MNDIEDFFAGLESDGQTLLLTHQRAKAWFKMNRMMKLNNSWSSNTDEARYFAERINLQIRNFKIASTGFLYDERFTARGAYEALFGVLR